MSRFDPDLACNGLAGKVVVLTGKSPQKCRAAEKSDAYTVDEQEARVVLAQQQ